MKIKIPKQHRTKKAKIAFLKRSAAAKAHHHRKRHKKLALRHAFVLGLLGIFTLATTGVVAAMADNLIPPPSPPIDMTPYIEQAKAERAAAAAAKQAAESAPDQSGVASWYALGLKAPDALTCASTKYPRGTYLRVKNLRNGAQVTCLVNDYGPQPGTKRVIDLSRGSFTQIGSLGSGTLPVEIRVVAGP